MGVTIDDKEVAMSVLNCLPPKYDHLIVALDTMGNDTKLTLEFTKSRLMQEEQKSNERELRNPSKVKTEDAELVENSSQKNVGQLFKLQGFVGYALTSVLTYPNLELPFPALFPKFYTKLPKPVGATTTAAAVTCLHCQAPLRSGICDIC
jgi:gag-polypeptide of LTR copia-type